MLGRIATFEDFIKNCKLKIPNSFTNKSFLTKRSDHNEISSDLRLQSFFFLTELKEFRFFASTFMNLIEEFNIDLLCYFISYFPDGLVVCYRKSFLFVLVWLCFLRIWIETCCLDKLIRQAESIDGEAEGLHLGAIYIVWGSTKIMPIFVFFLLKQKVFRHD